MFKKSNLNTTFNSGISRRSDFIKRDVPTHNSVGLAPRKAATQVVSRVAPKPYSPFYEESNLFMPRDRRETFAWARHFYASDPWVGNAIDLHSTYPLSSFGVKCESPEITKFFNDMLDELNFSSLIYDIAREYYILGEVFPYCELDEHSGKWSQIIVHNPDFIEVRSNVLTTPIISLIPDEELKRLVTSSNPDDIILRQQIPEDILTYIFAGRNIPLHPAFISHIARKPHPYLVRGTTILSRVFKDLMYRDKLREAQFCLPEETEVLTDRGFVGFKYLKLEDKIATVTMDNNELQYHKPKAIHSFDYDGELYHFKTRQIDVAVTPNHRMVVQNNSGKWKISRADEVKLTYKFRASIDKWGGDDATPSIELADRNVPTELFLEFAGYWLSDGCISKSGNREAWTTNISQNKNNKSYEKIAKCIENMPFNFHTYESKEVVNGTTKVAFNYHGIDLYSDMEEIFGKGAFNKFVPNWILEFSPRLLKILLDALVCGDGSVRERRSNKKYIVYSSVSKKLADNVQEIALKCGFSPSISTWTTREGSTIYSIKWSDRKIKTYGIKNDKRYPDNKSISTFHYTGKVWCPEVENGIFITRYNGRISIHGNTIADRHVTPLKIFKVGLPDGTYRPIAEDLANFRDLLEQAMYDPDFTIVTHPGLEVQYVGATGTILPLDSEMAGIEDRILTGLFTSKAFTHCLSEDTETLTKDGWKFYQDINENDEIATINPETNCLEYHKYNKKFVYDYNEDMIHFKSSAVDHLVTPNHKVWVSKKTENKFGALEADKVTPTYKFSTTFNWEGKTETHIKIGDKNIPINDYVLIVGLYLSEGSVYHSNDKYHKETGLKSKPCGIIISQAKYHKSGLNERYDTIKEILERNYELAELLSSRREKRLIENNIKITKINDLSEGFLIADHDLAKHLLETYGHGSQNKKIPTWVKEYSKEILTNLLEGSKLGDGSKLNSNNADSYEIYTISKMMADDLQEIAMKCGYPCFIAVRKNRPGNRRDCYRVRIFIKGNTKKNMFVTPNISKNHINKIKYSGKVYCFDIKNHIFIVRRNGKSILTKNSEGPTYSNASVALEVLQQRYVSFRTLIQKWLEWKVFRPICKINDFHRYNNGVKELIIPKVNWEKINLKNNREYQDSLANLARDNKVSLQSLYKALDLNYEEEVANIKIEIEDWKEILYKIQTPYAGKENINVATQDAEQLALAKPEENNEMGDLGGTGGMSEGGGEAMPEMGSEGGDMGVLPDLGGEVSLEGGAAASPEPTNPPV